MSKIATVEQGSILTDLSGRGFTMGTMFWVAESLSDLRSEYETANRNFGNAMEPGSPFCAGYMEDSHGYEVDGIRFPATPVGVADVETSLGSRSTDLVVRHIDPDPAPIRPGEPGFVLATGRAA